MADGPEMVLVCTKCGTIHADVGDTRKKFNCMKCRSVLTRMPVPKAALPQALPAKTGIAGKIIMGTLGFAVGGPLGAALGIAMGHDADKGKR